MSRERWVAIVNPRSRRGLSRTALDALRADLASCVDEICVSERAGHIDALIRRSHDADGFLVVGGDGTLFEVLQAMDRRRQQVALVPRGRGNSLARDLGVRTVADARDGVRAGVGRPIDLLSVTARLGSGHAWQGVSASNVALGYPADVAHEASRWRGLGAFSYAAGGVLARPVVREMVVTWDDDPPEETRLTGLIVSKSRYVGPFLGFPHASLDDGVGQVMALRASRLRQAIHNVSSLTRLGFYDPSALRTTRRCHIALKEPVLLKIDGEIFRDVREIDVSVLPRAVTFRLPR